MAIFTPRVFWGRLRRAWPLGLFAPVVVGIGPAYAQGDQEQGLEEVTVTGSRITRSGMTTPTPVTLVTNAELADMSPGNMIHSLSQLPQFYGNSNPDQPGFFNSSPGAGNLDLRGLGPNRTLSLLNGRRVVPSSRLGSTDINVFPEPMVSRIEIVTGGASAAYGTDAVAGVVNFILDTEFEGLETHAQTGVTSRGDNESSEVSLAFGTPIGERLHLLLSADYYEQDGARGYEDRDWFQGYGLVRNPNPGPTNVIAPNVVATSYTEGGLINQPGSALHRLMFLADGSVTPFVESDLSGSSSQSITNGGTGYNPGGDPYVAQLATENSRDSMFAYLDWELTDNINLYWQGIIGENELEQSNTPAVMFPPVWQATIFQDNAYLPDNIRQVMIDEDLESFGFARYASSADLATNRVIVSNEMRSATFGMNMEIESSGFFDGWNAQGHLQYGQNTRVIRQADWIRTDRIFMALDAVRDPATGAVVCRAALFDHPDYRDCVPMNLFGAGRPSQAAMDYVTGQNVGSRTITTPLYISSSGLSDDGYADGITATYTAGSEKIPRSLTEQRVAEFSMDGEVWEGWGAGPVSLAFGGGYREESVFQIVEDITNPASDPNLIVAPGNDPSIGIQGVPSGFSSRPTGFQFSNFPNIKGEFDVKEMFAETLVPLVSGGAVADTLSFNLAARWADYSGSGEVSSWKYGLDWQINDSVRLRATRSLDVRAATLAEQLDRQGSPSAVMDPENNDELIAVGGNVGGNPALDPEEADTITAGIVYQPAWAEGLSISADWYDIKISGAIGQLGSQRVVDECFAGALELCQFIERDPATNLILSVDNLYLNINQARVSGADLELSYGRQANIFGGGEFLGARVFVGWLGENSITNIGAPKLDRVGETGSLDFPEFKVTANLTYVRGPLTVFLQQRWLDGGLRRVDDVEGVDIDDNSIDSVRYTDVNVSYELETDGGAAWEIFGNVTNLLDEDPPIAANFSLFGGASQTNSGLHDVLGRRYVVGARLRF